MPHKLLLADDSVTIQRVIELTFATEDVQVLTVGDGEQAIARVQTDHPDIVLADIAMPKRNGYDVAAFIKSRPELSHIPVLLLAGAFEPVDELRARQSGCDGVLVKPFEPQHVIARVRELLSGAKGSPMQAVADVPRPVERLMPHRDSAPQRREQPPPPGPRTAASEGYGRSGVHEGPAAKSPTETATDSEFDFTPSKAPMQSASRGGTSDSLDDYFDRLDAAFANLGGAAPPRPAAGEIEQPAVSNAERPAASNDERPAVSNVERPAVSNVERRPVSEVQEPIREKDLDWFDQPRTINVPVERIDPAHPVAEQAEPPARPVRPAIGQMDEPWFKPSPRPSPGAPPVSPIETPIVRPIEPPPATSASLPPTTIDWSPGRPIQPPSIEPPESPPTLSAQSAAPPISSERVPSPPEPGRTIADAFVALLAVEQGEPGAVPVRLAPPVKPEIDDAMIEDIARRVAERLTPGAMRDAVRDVVARVAERVVREELARLKNKKVGG
jgi:CheY-like chemotaxis protein